jgi:hypothetical protein
MAQAPVAPAPKTGTISFHKEPEPPPEIRPAALQGPAQPPAATPPRYSTSQNADYSTYRPQLEPPGSERVFRLESEASYNERLRQEAKDVSREQVVFPDEPIVSRERFQSRAFAARAMTVEPNYVLHKPLLFEQPNMERYGWDLGVISPVVSAGAFFGDVLTLPYHLGEEICRGPQTSAGKCLPGDPVPYLLYPPGLSLKGAIAELSAAAVLFVAFP